MHAWHPYIALHTRNVSPNPEFITHDTTADLGFHLIQTLTHVHTGNQNVSSSLSWCKCGYPNCPRSLRQLCLSDKECSRPECSGTLHGACFERFADENPDVDPTGVLCYKCVSQYLLGKKVLGIVVEKKKTKDVEEKEKEETRGET